MKYIVRLIIILPILIFYTTCNHTGIKKFVFEAELTGYRFPVSEIAFPIHMRIYNDYLILCQLNSPNFLPNVFFHIYSLSDNTYKGAFGRRGRGPGEWINPNIAYSSANSKYLYISESISNNSIIYKMVLDSINQLTETDRFSVKKEGVSISNLVVSKDSLFIFDEYPPEPALNVHHLSGDHPVFTWKYGSKSDNIFLNEDRGTLRANDSHVIFLYNYKDRIDFMDWNLKLKKRLNYQKNESVIQDFMDITVYYNSGAYLGEKFLYALRLGMSNREYTIKRQQNEEVLELEVFDLNGTPICRYTFSEPAPTEFVVDERTFMLYGYRGSDIDNDFISVYPLPGLKEYLQNK